MLDLVGAAVLLRSGPVRPVRPDRLLGMGLALARYGVTPATGCAAAAARTPGRLALVDDQGELTFREVDRRGGPACLTTEHLGAVATEPGPRAPGRPRNASGQVILTSGTTDAVLAAVERHRATALVVVPVMLGALVEAATNGSYDTSSLRIIASSGSALSGGLAFSGYTDGSDRDRLGDLVATGDLGRLDSERRLTVLGRDDDMVVIGGENVYPAQVEDVLHCHPSVQDVAVVDVPDDRWGARLVAHVVPADGADVEDKELQELVRRKVARFAVPREVKLVDELPRNTTGKVLKRELREA